MNDPHVEALHYRVKHSEFVDYKKASPLEYEGSSFSVHIQNYSAKIALKEHFATAESARAIVEPFLRAWELSATLFEAVDKFEFEFQNADIIDRNPPTSGYVLSAAGGTYAISGAKAVAHIGRASYPAAPKDLAWSAEVDLMLHCYRAYRQDQRRLGEACYFCLTVLQGAAGGRHHAAKKFGISSTVLNWVAKLSSEKGGREARKIEGAHTELSPSERIWLEEALKILIRRAAQVANDPHARQNQITMSNLPPTS